MTQLASLERFVARIRRNQRARAGARCEVCGEAIGPAHRHVVDRTDRRLLCACTGCVIAFDGEQPARFRSVPDRRHAESIELFGDRDFDALGIPVGLAFFFRSSSLGRWVAAFPSVAGATEAELPEDAWAALEARSDRVRRMASDVEALLVRRHRDARYEGFIVPVDVCYELTGLLRQKWRGIDGGDEARAALDALFADLAASSAENRAANSRRGVA
ncbi:MAG: hypothetical protein JWO86_5191 [Myxococcaceae bacterium]|nr:hypothetical protein [Myxococcaceae bacterium]